MAAAIASSRQHPAAVQQLTPPSSSHGGGASWDFAVPLHHTDASYEQEPYMSHYANAAHAPRQPHTSQANGYAQPVRSPTWDSQNQGYTADRSYAMTDRANGLHKKPSGDLNTISNDPNSVLDYYKSQANTRKGPTAVSKGKPRKKTSKGGPQDPNWAAVEHDENNWIHRDKLKEIETKELEAAGFIGRASGRASGSNSRSQSATRKPRDRRGSEVAGHNGEERGDGRRVVSPIPAEDEETLERDQTWSPTTFEELASGEYPASPRTNTHNGRPSTSRIPLPKASGIPVPAAVAERDAPLPRSRAGSGNWNGDAIATNGARVRSGSVGSQFLLDEPEGERETTPPYGHSRKLSANSGSPPKSPQKSPMKAKTPSKAGPAAGGRKTSVKVQPKNRQASGTTPPKRPGTSGGASRPTTAHRPEGEAPWLATMYKPDPRLPPDQQIIPTHAKRIQQEQWENEGRVGSMYDRDFRLLNTEEINGKRLSQLDPLEFEKARNAARNAARNNEAWPLPSPEKSPSPQPQEPALEKIDTNVSTKQGNEQGAYKLTPTIPQGPRVPSPKLAPPIAPAGSQPKTTRLPEPVEETKEKKGCCCIVM